MINKQWIAWYLHFVYFAPGGLGVPGVPGVPWCTFCHPTCIWHLVVLEDRGLFRLLDGEVTCCLLPCLPLPGVFFTCHMSFICVFKLVKLEHWWYIIKREIPDNNLSCIIYLFPRHIPPGCLLPQLPAPPLRPHPSGPLSPLPHHPTNLQKNLKLCHKPSWGVILIKIWCLCRASWCKQSLDPFKLTTNLQIETLTNPRKRKTSGLDKWKIRSKSIDFDLLAISRETFHYWIFIDFLMMLTWHFCC